MIACGIDTFRIALIQKYPCTTKEELTSQEYKITNQITKTGVPVYNSMINGKLSKAKLKRGSVCFIKSRQLWTFAWYPEPGKKEQVSFSVGKYGDRMARNLAEKAQKKIYLLK